MPSRVDVSIIIPAFDEEERLPPFLDRVIAYCQASVLAYEIIVVDDGSTDRTFDAASSLAISFPRLNVVRLTKNRGKGYAVRTGALRSRGDYVLYMDADGSVAPDEIERNLEHVRSGTCDVFVGSRALHGEEQVLVTERHRVVIGSVFGMIVRLFLLRGIRDSQCGFKIFPSRVARELFSRAYIDGFGFDLEILYLARRLGMTIREGPVSWRSVGRSKVNLIADSARMLVNVFQIRACHSRRTRREEVLRLPSAVDAELERIEKIEEWHWWLVARRKFMMGILRGWDGVPGQREVMILDAGCGTGRNGKALGELGRVFGVDDSERSIELCKEKGFGDVTRCRVEEMDFSDDVFDIVTCLDVLEHIPDVASALQAVRRVHRPGGLFLVIVPAVWWLWSGHDEALLHLRRYSKGMLRSELEEAGYDVRLMGYLFALPLVGIGMARLFSALIRRKGSRSDLEETPSKVTNGILRFVTDLEMRPAMKGMLPFGSSLFALAVKAV